MAIGVAVANAILLVTFAEQARRDGGIGARRRRSRRPRARMRPVLMTSAAMIAGMIPMALALGEGAEATAPLGRAVIGGLAAATIATLVVLPSVYSLVQRTARPASPSLDPDDPASASGAAEQDTRDDRTSGDDAVADAGDSSLSSSRRRQRRSMPRGDNRRTAAAAPARRTVTIDVVRSSSSRSTCSCRCPANLTRISPSPSTRG